MKFVRAPQLDICHSEMSVRQRHDDLAIAYFDVQAVVISHSVTGSIHCSLSFDAVDGAIDRVGFTIRIRLANFMRLLGGIFTPPAVSLACITYAAEATGTRS